MISGKRNETFKQCSIIFLLGFVFGGYVFRCCIRTYMYIKECKDPIYRELGKGQDESSHIFLGVLRTRTDTHEIGVVNRLMGSHVVRVQVIPCTPRSNTGDFYIQPTHIHHLYTRSYEHDWFVLTANVIVDTNLLSSFLSSVTVRAPAVIVHPACTRVKVLVLNQAALVWLIKRSGYTSMCGVLSGITTMSLQQVWRIYERRHSLKTHAINVSLVFPLRNEDVYSVLIKYQQQRIRLLRERFAFLKKHINFITLNVSSTTTRQLTQLKQRIPNFKEWSFINSTFIHSLDNSNAQPKENVYNRGRHLIYNVSRSAVPPAWPCEPVYIYQRVEAGAGVQHVVVYGNNTTCQPNYRTVQPFEGYEFAEEASTRDKNTTIVIPLFKRFSIFSRFLKRLQSVGLDYRGTLVLQVALFKDKSGEYKKTLNCAKESRGRVIVNMLMVKGKFSRSTAIVAAIEKLPGDTRVLIIDVDMMFTARFLERVAVATKKGQQAFFPIQFSRYDPDTVLNKTVSGQPGKRVQLSEHLGRWRYFSYGTVSIYKSDVISVGNFDTSVKGWGMEDILFFSKCVNSDLRVFRSVDPGLWHMHHIRHCDVNLQHDQLRMCQKSRLALETSHYSLAAYVLGLIH